MPRPFSRTSRPLTRSCRTFLPPCGSTGSGSTLRNYLLRAVHNNSLRLLKYDEARRRREISAAAELHGGWDQEKEVPPPELAPAISRLPEQSRKVLLMSYWENKKNAAIATELSISVRTVETILYKVVKKLRGEIKKK